MGQPAGPSPHLSPIPGGCGQGSRTKKEKDVTLVMVPNAGILSFEGGSGLVANSCLTLVTPWAVAHQAPLSMGFPWQEYWSELPFPASGDLPNSRIKPSSPVSTTGRQVLYHGAT